MPLLICTNRVFYVQYRNSRHSVSEFRRRRALLKNYRIDKCSEVENVYDKLNSPLEELVPVTPAKTSITIDALDSNSYSHLSRWRKENVVRRARRVLPLPISLTTDDKLGYSWKQRYIKSLKEREFTRNHENFYNQIPDFIKIMNETNQELLKDKFPDLYKKYNTITHLMDIDNDELNKSIDKTTYFPFFQTFNANFDQDVLEDNQYESNKQPGFVDEEYNNFLKHNELLQFLASNLKSGPYSHYEPEIKDWASQLWLRNYGNSDASIAPSKVPCSGCGAHLHCVAPNIPGFIPVQKFTLFNENELRSQKCQRCEFLKKYNVSLNVTVSDEEYPNLISKIHANKTLVIILVDLLDFPCSVWPGIINLIGEKHLIYIVGNKVDLLPKDDKLYLERIKKSLKESLKSTHINRETKIRDISLISAKTGYGVENLVTKLLRDLKHGQDIYLIGCTNSGKSTLFNVLMQSDLCALGDHDLMNRATTSVWPGTTISLLKFPIRKMKGWEMQMRLNKLNLLEKHDIAENNLLRNLSRQSKIRFAHLSERLNFDESLKPPFIMESHHPLINTVKNNKLLDQKNYSNQNYNFLNDTPGVIYKDQLLNLLTTEELLRTIPREIITPRTYTLRPFQSLFIGGLARIDLIHARQHVWMTVFASLYLPINIVYTEQAKGFYETHVGTEFLGVPIGNDERLKYWPMLSPKEIQLNCIGWEESCADVVLSSAGWIAITGGADTKCVIKAFTPECRGIYVRNPAMLPYAIRLRGKRILGTPCFENKLFTIDDLYSQPKEKQEVMKKNKKRPVTVINEERIKNAVRFIKG